MQMLNVNNVVKFDISKNNNKISWVKDRDGNCQNC